MSKMESVPPSKVEQTMQSPSSLSARSVFVGLASGRLMPSMMSCVCFVGVTVILSRSGQTPPSQP